MKALKIIAAAAVAVVALSVAAAGWRYLRDNRLPNFTRSAEVYVYPGATARFFSSNMPSPSSVTTHTAQT